MLRRLTGGPGSCLLRARALATVHGCAQFVYPGEGEDRNGESLFSGWVQEVDVAKLEAFEGLGSALFPLGSVAAHSLRIDVEGEVGDDFAVWQLEDGFVLADAGEAEAAGAVDGAITALGAISEREHPLCSVEHPMIQVWKDTALSSNLEVSKIRIDGGTQTRLMLDNSTIEEYAQLWSEGIEFPPLVVFYSCLLYTSSPADQPTRVISG